MDEGLSDASTGERPQEPTNARPKRTPTSPLVEISQKAEAARKKAKAQQVGLGSSDWYVKPARKGFGGQEVRCNLYLLHA